MIDLNAFLHHWPTLLEHCSDQAPWEITSNLRVLLQPVIAQLNSEFDIAGDVAVHRSSTIEDGAVLKGPLIIMGHCFVGAHAYFREGGLVAPGVKIGPGSEIKSSVICSESAVAHFNYIGNSIIGHRVNFEAGSIAANHYNERADKEIRVRYEGRVIATGAVKFGALVGDHVRIGANAVLSPGTVLPMHSVVKRLELVEQNPVQTGSI